MESKQINSNSSVSDTLEQMDQLSVTGVDHPNPSDQAITSQGLKWDDSDSDTDTDSEMEWEDYWETYDEEKEMEKEHNQERRMWDRYMDSDYRGSFADFCCAYAWLALKEKSFSRSSSRSLRPVAETKPEIHESLNQTPTEPSTAPAAYDEIWDEVVDHSSEIEKTVTDSVGENLPTRSYVMQTPHQSYTFSLPITDPDDIDYYSLPFDWTLYLRLVTPYLTTSPFFTRIFKEQIDARGEEEWLEIFNDYLQSIATYRESTLKWWRHGCFGTRKARDGLCAFIKNRTVKAEAGIETDSTEQQENTTFTDQRETTMDEGYTTTQTSPSLQKVSMQEAEWHVRNVMSKPLVAFTLPWTTSQNQGDLIMRRILPGDFLLGPHYNLCSTFVFFRSTTTLRFQINSNKFNFGRLIISFASQYSLGQYSDYLFTIDNMLAMPHVIIDASVSNTGILHIPFVHMNTYFNTVIERPQEFLGTVLVGVFNKLGSTTGASQTVDLTCWVSFDDCELHQPCQAHEVVLPKSKSTLSPRPIMAEAGLEGVVKSAADSLLPGSSSLIPLVKDLIAPSATMTSGDVGGASSNCDKPTDPQELSRWVPNTLTSLNFGEGIDKSNRLSLKPGTATIASSELISTTTDDMNLHNLMKIPTRLTTFTWTTQQAPATLLRTIPIYPCNASKCYTDSTPREPVDVWEIPLLAYCTRPSKYYRGGMYWEVEVISNTMMSGRIQIAMVTGFSSTEFNICNYLNTYTLDIQEKSVIKFVTPYMSERPWLRCDKFKTIEQGAEHDPDISTGKLVFHVLNRLTVPDSTAQTIDINVSVAAADDYELAFPTDLATFQGIGSVVPIGGPVKAEAGAEAVGDSRHGGTAITLTRGGGGVSGMAASTMSENSMDLKTLTRRYCKVFENEGTLERDSVIAFSNTPCLSGVNKGFNGEAGCQFRTYLCHFGELFTFWRGSLRYKLIITVTGESRNNVIVEAFHMPGVYSYINFTPRPTTRAYRQVLGSAEAIGTIAASTQIQNSLEFEVPFYTPYTQLRTLLADANYSAQSSTGTIFVRLHGLGNTAIRLSLYQAAGDDFAFNYFRCSPRVQMLKDAEKNRLTGDSAPWIYDPDYMPQPEPARFSDKVEDLTSETSAVTGPPLETLPRAEAGGYFDWIPRNPYTVTMNTIEAIGTAADTTTNTVNGIASRCGLTNQEEDDGGEADEPDETWTTFAGFMNSLPSLVGCSVKLGMTVSGLVSGFQAYFTAPNSFVKACSIIAILKELFGTLIVKYTKKLTQFALNVITNLGNGSKQGNQLPRAEAEVIEFVPALVAIVTTTLVILGFKSIPDDKESQNLLNTVSNKLRLFNFSASAISNIKGLFTQMKDLTEWIIDQILQITAPQFLARMKLERGFEDIERWAQFIDAIDGTDYADRSNYDLEFRNECMRCVDKAQHFTRLLITGKIGREANIIKEYARRALEIGENINDSWKKLPIRIDPFCIAIVGETNVGKSACITEIAYTIMDRLGYAQHNRWCPVNITEKFFTENYRQQTAIYMDDISLFTGEDQYNKFCALKSNAQYPLDMAFRKGEYFNSHFIFATSNVRYPRPNFCSDLAALQRRRNILLEARFRTEADRTAVNNGDNTRRLGMAHAEFRIIPSCDPTLDPTFPPMPADDVGWMNFENIVDTLVERARLYLYGANGQMEKFQRDLTRMGYAPVGMPLPADVVPAALNNAPPVIIPQAEAGVQEGRHIDVDKCLDHNSLMYWDEDIFKNLVWSDVNLKFVLDPTCINEQVKQAYAEFDNVRKRQEEQLNNEQRGKLLGRQWKTELDMALDECSTLKNPKWQLMTRVKGSLESCRKYITGLWETAKKALPWLAVLETWPAKLVGACLALVGVAGVLKKVVHKCYCHSVRYYGYRCGMCGRWPNIDQCIQKEWLMREWRSLYGMTEEYENGRVTTLEEERNYLALEGISELDKPWIGTKTKLEAQAGPYSDVTKGAALHRVIPHLGPYSDVTRGAALNQVVAHAGIRTEELIQNRVIPALYRVRTGNGLNVMSMNALAIGGRNLLMPKHFTDMAKKNGSFEVYHSTAWLKVELQEERMREFPGKDLVCYDMPIQFHQHKDLTNHFVEEAALAKMKTTSAIIVRQDASLYPSTQICDARAVDEQKYAMDYQGVTESYVTRGMWKYRALTGPGTCGSVLMTMDNKSNGTILGLHACGDGVYGWAVLITREMISSLIKTGKLGTPLPKAEAIFGTTIPEGHFGRIGKLPKGVFQTDKTTIIPTKIQGMVAPVKTAPSALSSRDPRLTKKVNIMRNCINKYGKAPTPFNLRHRKMISDDLRSEMDNWTLQREPQILTEEEMIKGIDGFEGFDRLPMATSPGFPWVLTRPAGESGKAYLFDLENHRINDLELKRKMEQRERMALLGERVESVWTCCLKDERRPLVKVASGSTRLFVIPPVDYSLLCRKYSLDYAVALKDNRRIAPSKVGIDPQSLEWTELYNYIAEFSPFVFAGDFTTFDGTLAPDLIEDFWKDMDYFYKKYGKGWKQEDQNVRLVLADEGIHTVCLANDEAFMTHTGNKSGNPQTVNQNGDVNSRYLKHAFLGLAERNGKLATMAEYHKYVKEVVYGDDNIVAVKPEILDWFNQNSVSQFLAEFGITYTSATKDSSFKDFISLEEMTFLKQHFRDHENIKGIKVPIMSETTITELLNWTRVAPDQDVLLESNCNDALRFAYFYGFEYFNGLRNKIMHALKTTGTKLRIMTYDDFHYWFLFVIGMMPSIAKCEAFFETVAKSGNSPMAQWIQKLLERTPYKLLSMTGLLRAKDNNDRTDNRHAIAIPSGEGKSWLCNKYPNVFVDHDEILLPEARRRLNEKGLDWKHLWGMFDLDFPEEDRRILLVHHPNNTKRQILGTYVLPKPNYIRANAYQRLRLEGAKRMERDDRNMEIMTMARTTEPQLFGCGLHAD